MSKKAAPPPPAVTEHGTAHLPSGKQLQGTGDARHRPASCTSGHEQADNAADSGPGDRLPPARAFHLVALGASAGGLQAFNQFFQAMPADSGLAFIMVAHLSPDRFSYLPELIRKHTAMPVLQVTDHTPVRPNHIYIIPPNAHLLIEAGVLYLLEPRPPGHRDLPINIFLQALARDQADKAIAIILSGTGSDGTLGLKQIKDNNGMVMVQDPDSAEHDGMPLNAIESGLADYILAPAAMPAQLLRYVRHAASTKIHQELSQMELHKEELQKIFSLLRSHTGHDFSLYKKNTLCRRLERRMHVQQIDALQDYTRYLAANPPELTTLFKDLLIHVTGFFRDPEAFEILRDHYLLELLREKKSHEPLRIWVPGCSSGEEAYTIAILVQECLDLLNRQLEVQIFGTDIDEESIQTARAGLYPASIAADISPARLQRFFISQESSYQIKKPLRDYLIFAPQNIIKDPPFTKLDLLCCRNLLIYFSAALQNRLLPVFHYSLREGGLLFLGSSESLGQAANLFTLLETRWKIYRRLPTTPASQRVTGLPPLKPSPPAISREPKIPPARQAEPVDFLLLMEKILQQSGLAPCVVINGEANIIYLHGRTGKFLEPAAGRMSVNIIEMAKPGLKAPLASIIRKAAATHKEEHLKGLELRDDDQQLKLDLSATPVFNVGRLNSLLLITFREEVQPGGTIKPKRRKPPGEVEQLRQELRFTREDLQSTIEELETANEELKSTNEELQSTNEELQSANEELETAKEELQSLNEESDTINVELQHRIDELSKANDDMKNLLDSTTIAIIFLDIHLKIRRFTAKATELIPLTAADLGRPLHHLVTRLINIDLQASAQQVLDDLGKIELEVRSTAERDYLMKISPYRTLQNLIDGVVIIFDDITILKQTERRLRCIFQELADPIIVEDLNGLVLDLNAEAEKVYGWSRKELVGQPLKNIVPPAEHPHLEQLYQQCREQHAVRNIEGVRQHKDGSLIKVILTMTLLVDETGKPTALVSAAKDITRLRPT